MSTPPATLDAQLQAAGDYVGSVLDALGGSDAPGGFEPTTSVGVFLYLDRRVTHPLSGEPVTVLELGVKRAAGGDWGAALCQRAAELLDACGCEPSAVVSVRVMFGFSTEMNLRVSE